MGLGPVHGSATVSTSLLMPEDSISFRSARASLAILGRGHACSAARADMYRTAGPAVPMIGRFAGRNRAGHRRLDEGWADGAMQGHESRERRTVWLGDIGVGVDRGTLQGESESAIVPRLCSPVPHPCTTRYEWSRLFRRTPGRAADQQRRFQGAASSAAPCFLDGGFWRKTASASRV
jgi:hypothetical protein